MLPRGLHSVRTYYLLHGAYDTPGYTTLMRLLYTTQVEFLFPVMCAIECRKYVFPDFIVTPFNVILGHHISKTADAGNQCMYMNSWNGYMVIRENITALGNECHTAMNANMCEL